MKRALFVDFLMSGSHLGLSISGSLSAIGGFLVDYEPKRQDYKRFFVGYKRKRHANERFTKNVSL